MKTVSFARMIHGGLARDSRDVCALFLPVVLFSPVSLVSLEPGIADRSRNAYE
jgi:hypothetical protein